LNDEKASFFRIFVVTRFLSFLLFVQLIAFNTAFAQAAPQKAPGLAQVIADMAPMMIMVFLVFYFLVIKPQEKKMKEQKKLLESIKKGDQVITTAGIIGKVAAVEKDNIMLEVGPNTKIKFEPSHILRVYE